MKESNAEDIALKKYLENPHWAEVYNNAPDGAKRYYRESFAFSIGALAGNAKGDGTDATDDWKRYIASMDDKSWNYILNHADNITVACGLQMSRRRLRKDLGIDK